MAREKILLHYLREVEYNNDLTNQIGSDADYLNMFQDGTPVRTIPTPGGNIAYVRKFGVDYLIKSVSDGPSVTDINMNAEVFAKDGTRLAHWEWDYPLDTPNGSRPVANYTNSGTDQDLDSPGPYDSASSFIPIRPSPAYAWESGQGECRGTPDAPGNTVPWPNHAAISYDNYLGFESTGAGINWSIFANSSNNGIQRLTYSKFAHNDGLGGYVEYYYHSAAWTYAFNGNQSKIIIAQNKSVYKDSISDANLVVRWDGVVGLAGGATSTGSWAQDAVLTTEQGCYIKYTASGGDITCPASITIDTDVDPSGKTFPCTSETVTDGYHTEFHFTSSGACYYDSELKYGGLRHTPALNDTINTYYKIEDAYAALAASNDDGIEILDSEIYDEDFTDGVFIIEKELSIYATLGQSPTIKSGVGARDTRNPIDDWNNSTIQYLNENGDNNYPGTFHYPKKTINNIPRVNKAIYGGVGATRDGGIFYEQTTSISAGWVLDADHGYMPVITSLSTGNLITETNSLYVAGWTLRGALGVVTDGHGFVKYTGSSTSRLYDLTIENCQQNGIYLNCSSGNVNTLIKKCLCRNNGLSGLDVRANDFISITFTTGIKNNICMDNGTNGLYVTAQYQPGAMKVNNNIAVGNGSYGIYHFVNSSSVTSQKETVNNTAYKNNIGFYVGRGQTSYLGVLKDNVSYGNTTRDFEAAYNTVTMTYSTYLNLLNVTAGTGCTTTDPDFTGPTDDDVALGVKTGARNTGSNGQDMGALFSVLSINSNNVELSGLIIDCGSVYFQAISKYSTTDYTGVVIKSCAVQNSVGISINFYDLTEQETIITDIFFKNNYIGMDYVSGEVITERSIFYNCNYGIIVDATGPIFSRLVFYSCVYGIYIYSSSGNVGIESIIFNNNSLYDVYAEVTTALLYCCNTGIVNSLVDNTSDTNIADSPLFVAPENLDYRLKSFANGDLFDSPCIEAGRNGVDMGAYSQDRSILSDSFEKYELQYNPIELNPAIQGKGLVSSESPSGGVNVYGKEHKRYFEFNFGTEQLSSKELRETMALMSKLVQTRKNQYTKEQIRVRLHERPTTFIETGSAATIDSTEKTILDSSKNWVRDQLEGYWVGIKFANGSGNGSIDASAKTLTVSGAGWTIDQWKEYYIYNNGYYYAIASNTSEVLTLGDPKGTLTTEAGIDWAIEKYFEIKSNTNNTLTLFDEDEELSSGSYDYYVDFIVVKVVNSEFTPIAAGIYDYENEELKTGYSLQLEQE